MTARQYPRRARRNSRLALLGALALVMPWRLAAADSLPPTIAIIIDDMGNADALGEQLIKANEPLTLSFLPFRPYTRQQAEEAHARGKDVMLHMPMANTRGLALGAAGLTPDMDQRTMVKILRRSLEYIPHVQGMNNHMGSLLTQERQPMDWVMGELAHYALYFVDSRTIATTVAAPSAEAHHIPNFSRDVFLDDVQTQAAIDVQFKRLIALARRNGTAIAIGHPHPETVHYLLQHLPQLDAQGIAVATISGLWRIRHNNVEMFAGEKKEPVVPNLASWQDLSRELQQGTP